MGQKLSLALPRSVDGRKIPHPVVLAVKNHSQMVVATVLGVTRQTLNELLQQTTANRDMAIAAHHAPKISVLAGVPLSAIRPDVYVDMDKLKVEVDKLVKKVAE